MDHFQILVWGFKDGRCKILLILLFLSSMAEGKLKTYRVLEHAMISDEGKSFLGLGSTTKTPGQRTIPFALRLKDGETVDHGQPSDFRVAENPSTSIAVCPSFLKTHIDMKKGTVMMESNGKYKELEHCTM